MKLRFLVTFFLLASVAEAQYTIPARTGGVGAGAPVGGTWTLVQKTGYQTSSSSPASVTVTSTGTGHLLVLMGHTNTGTTTVSSVSGAGTWSIPAGCHVNGGGSIGGTDCAYNLSSTSGVTSISITLSASGTSTWIFYEYSFSGSSFSLDTTGTVTDGTAGTSLAGVGLTLAGTKDVIVQGLFTSGGNVTGVSTPYSNFQGTSFTGQADLENTSSGTAPTWTNSNSQTAAGAAIAIQGSGGGGGGVTWTLVQHPNNLTCTSTTTATTQTCTVSTTSTGSAHGLIVFTSIFEQTTGSGHAPTLNGITGDPGLTHCPAAYVAAFVSATNSNAAVDCDYVTSSTSSETSFTVTWNTPSLAASPNVFIDVEFYEVSKSSGSISLDTTNNTSTASCNTSCTGVSLSLTGSNDYIAQGTAFDNPTVSGPGSPWTNPVDLDQTNVTSAFVGALGQSSGTAPTFSTSGATGYFVAGACALK
jgi:hypothetical protein